MRILLIGDAIVLSTGFSQVLRHIAVGLVARGHDVWQLASLDTPPTCDSAPYRALGVTPRFPAGDPVGFDVLGVVLEECKPDVILVTADAGMALEWIERGVDPRRAGVPVVLYAPVEGAPIHPLLAQAFRHVTQAITFTAWSSEHLFAEHHLTVPFVYHGVDAAVWRPAEPVQRTALREALGWTDKFVTAYVARNNGRKGHDRLIRAMLDLPDHHRLYLHCAPYDHFQLGGWDLGWMVEALGLQGRVQFSPQPDAIHGISEVSLADRLAAADLYVSASKVEGFGLPLLEAMSAGLPVIVPDDRGNQREVVGGAGLAYLRPSDWDTWFHGAKLACVAPETIAEAIRWAEAHPDERAAASERGRGRALDPAFRWETMVERLIGYVEAAAKVELVPA